jgi:hypothetical protein
MDLSWLRSIGLVGLLLVALLLGESAFAPAAALEKWGPFRGRVVDRETGQGIPGAVILAIWIENVPTPIEMHSRFYDAKEAVTGPDGSFEIPRRPPPFFTFKIREPEFKVFAPGYAEEQWVVNPPSGQPLIEPTVIEMRQLKTAEELRKKSRSYPSQVPEDRMPEFIRAINVERKLLGMNPIGSSGSSPK